MTKFVASKYKGVVPDSGEKPGVFSEEEAGDPDPTFTSDINTLLTEYIDTMDAVKIRAGLHLVMQVSARGNEYLQRTQFFKLFESNPALCAKVTSRALNLIYALSALVHPFMPSTTNEILAQLNAPARTVPTQLSNDLLAGHTLGAPDYLFKKIEEKNADVWRVQFGGKQAGAAAVEVIAKPTSKRAAAKQQKAAIKEAVVVAPSGPKSPEVIAIEEKITAQGDKVRRIKGGKAEEGDGDLDEAIAQLKQLKLDLQEVATSA